MKQKILTILLVLTASAGMMFASKGIGVFSVSATQQVTFSPGNLQFNAALGSHQCADGMTMQGTWRFAEHQWDMVGMGYGQTNTDNWCYIGGTVQNSDNRKISSTYDGWIDLFGWGTSGWNSGANAYQPWSTSNAYSDYYPGGSYQNSLTGNYANADWGVYNQIGDDDPRTWRTLTDDEWYYLINTRTNAGSKYGAAKVNGMTGVVILPDVFTLPAGCGFTSGMTSANNNRDWSYVVSTNNYTSAQWQLMEAAGAVFLPCAGYRDGTTMDYAGTHCFYWSSTADDSRYAYYLHFASNRLYWNTYFRNYGRSVRLVSEIGDTPETYTVTFVNYDGSELQSREMEASTMPSYDGTTPTKPADAQYTYTFSGWTPEIVAVTGDATYTAVFEETLNTYTITWQDENGNVITTDEVGYGLTPEFTGTIPTKEEYEFVGWLPNIKPATEDTKYTTYFIPQAQAEEKVYTVNINGENCSLNINNQYPEGAVITIEAVADECFEFRQWSDGNKDNPRTVTVTKDMNLTAEFNKVRYTITDMTEPGAGGKIQVVE